LKLLHSLQEEVNQETEVFDKRHPDPTKLNDKELKQLQTIQANQQEIAELLDEWMTPPARSKPEGDKK
jgi:hypothetical protein